jgi:hypothetical protein
VISELLQKAAKSGRLNYLSVMWCNTEWEVTFRGVADKDHHYVRNKDIVQALQTALGYSEPKSTKPKPAAAKVSTMFEDDL